MHESNEDDDSRNIWHPHHSTVFADELIAALDEPQQRKLLQTLGGLSFCEWCEWLHANRQHIERYNLSTPRERAKLLKKAAEVDWLLVHHALLYVELARYRMKREFLHLPLADRAHEGAVFEREVVLSAWLAFDRWETEEWWPFEYRPEGFQGFPFADA